MTAVVSRSTATLPRGPRRKTRAAAAAAHPTVESAASIAPSTPSSARRSAIASRARRAAARGIGRGAGIEQQEQAIDGARADERQPGNGRLARGHAVRA